MQSLAIAGLFYASNKMTFQRDKYLRNRGYLSGNNDCAFLMRQLSVAPRWLLINVLMHYFGALLC